MMQLRTLAVCVEMLYSRCMDSLLFQAMAVELNNVLANSRLDKVLQPGAGVLVLKFWTGQEKLQLLFKAEGQGSYYLTREIYSAPAKPPRFCQLLRARLRRLVEVRAEPMDRVVHFLFMGPDSTRYDLVFEALGAQGNLILLDDAGRIVDLLYRQDQKRKLLPGEPYRLPEQEERTSLFNGTAEVARLFHEAESHGRLTAAKVFPLSPALAQAIADARQHGQSFQAILTRIKDVFAAKSFQPHKITWAGQTGFLPLSFGDQYTAGSDYADLSEMLERAQSEEGGESVKDLTSRMSAIIKKQRKRLVKRIEHIAAEGARQADPEKFRIYGDLLLANLHHFKRGAESVDVDDFYQSPPVKTTIELDSKVSPNENAERYFKMYRKAKRSGDHHARRLQETEDELAWLDQVDLSLDEARTGEELYQVQLELEAAGLLKEAKGQLGKRQQTRPEDQLYNALTAGGWQLYWGKNSRTNDYVSRTMTGPADLWFHAKGMPGAHLVLKCGENHANVAEEDVLYAASIAAGYSKGKEAGKVEVIVAQGKDVKKPKGAKPGLVTVDSYRSIVVAPLRLDA